MSWCCYCLFLRYAATKRAVPEHSSALLCTEHVSLIVHPVRALWLCCHTHASAFYLGQMCWFQVLLCAALLQRRYCSSIMAQLQIRHQISPSMWHTWCWTTVSEFGLAEFLSDHRSSWTLGVSALTPSCLNKTLHASTSSALPLKRRNEKRNKDWSNFLCHG
jgi:hypothetical protein